MRARSSPRRHSERPPYVVTPGGHVFCLPSVASGVRLVKIVDQYNAAQEARKVAKAAGQGGQEARHVARVVACMGAVVGALWWGLDTDLDTPQDRGPWTALDTLDADQVEAWGDAVAAELQAAGWSLDTLGDAFTLLAPALVALCTIKDAEVKARADFSEAPKVAPNA